MKFRLIEFMIIEITFGITYSEKRQYDVSYGSPTYKHCVCGRKNAAFIGDIRIVGGYQVKANEYPWMTMITKNGSLHCGGSLINDRYVLTAAHVLQYGAVMTDLKVVVGEYDFCQPSDQTAIISIERAIPHPDYNRMTQFADVMLVKLSMKVTFNEYIRPICLPDFNRWTNTPAKYGGKFATALGWGLADTGGGQVCALREVQLQIFHADNCDSNVDTLICAGVRGDNKRDTCTGDSGGPLQTVNRDDKYEVIGIISSGIGCGTGTPGYYTDVPRMIPWILKVTMRDSLYCWR